LIHATSAETEERKTAFVCLFVIKYFLKFFVNRKAIGKNPKADVPQGPEEPFVSNPEKVLAKTECIIPVPVFC